MQNEKQILCYFYTDCKNVYVALKQYFKTFNLKNK